MKKGLIILTILLSIMTVKVKAFELNPTEAKAIIENADGNGVMGLVNNNPGATQTTQDGEVYDFLFTYNVPYRLKYINVYGDGWPGTEDQMIIEYKTMVAWYDPNMKKLTNINSYWLSTLVDTDENGNVSLDNQGTRCTAIDEKWTNTNGVNRDVITWKCVVDKKLDYLRINTPHVNDITINTTWGQDFYVSHDITFRPPTSQQEVEDIINENRQWITDMFDNFEENIQNGYYDDMMSSYPGNDMTILGTYTIEENLFNYRNQENWNNVNLSIDTQASNWIWDKATQILNMDSKIMTMYLTILGIGLIRLVMG